MTTCSYFSPTVTLPQVKQHHISEGHYIKINDFKAYNVSRDLHTRKAVIVMHDMLGFNARSEQICDIIAAQGYRVVMPYLFQGEMYPPRENINELNDQDQDQQMSKVTSMDYISRVIEDVINYLRNESGILHFGVFGASWGGKCAALASRNKSFTAAVLMHTPWLQLEDLIDIQCPVALITTGDLKDLTPIVQSLRTTKPFSQKIVYQRFSDMRYGWVGVAGNYANPRVAELTTQALRVAVTFFKENVGIRTY